jgi:hypothetical protein
MWNLNREELRREAIIRAKEQLRLDLSDILGGQFENYELKGVVDHIAKGLAELGYRKELL